MREIAFLLIGICYNNHLNVYTVAIRIEKERASQNKYFNGPFGINERSDGYVEEAS
jgi:hypothetical protein